MSRSVASIADFKRSKRRRYLERFERRLDYFISDFMSENVAIDFMQIAERYQARQVDDHAMAWDYEDLREVVRSAIEESVGAELLAQLRQTSWYDERWISPDEVIDRCFSVFILGSSRVANQ